MLLKSQSLNCSINRTQLKKNLLNSYGKLSSKLITKVWVTVKVGNFDAENFPSNITDNNFINWGGLNQWDLKVNERLFR